MTLPQRFSSAPTRRFIAPSAMAAIAWWRTPHRQILGRASGPADLALRYAGASQAFQIMSPIPFVRERIILRELFEREVRLDLPKFSDVRCRFLAPAQVSERSNQWLVAI